MDINTLKEALGDEKFAQLHGYVTDLIGQRDTARNESITGRKSLKGKVDALEAQQAALLEKLGLSSAEELEALPDVKGMADAAKQLDARIKRAERERDEAKKTAEEASGKYRGSLQKAAIAEALGGHDFVARDIVETYVSQRLAWEGDDLLFKSDDGKLIPVKDGVAGIAKTRPELLKPQGTGGAGVRQSNAGGSGGAKTLTRTQYDSMTLEQKAAIDWKTVSMVD
ncbi:MAG: hypothetical protein RLZZ524_3109 [Pseudomonadota bacterium]|jgi:hypothetical protein